MASETFKVDGFSTAPELPPHRSQSRSHQIPTPRPRPPSSPPPSLDVKDDLESSLPKLAAHECRLMSVTSADPSECYPDWAHSQADDAELIRSQVLAIDALVVFGIIATLIMFGRNSWRSDSLHDNPLVGVPSSLLDQFGLKNAPQMLDHNEWWRLVSSILIHAGVIDLVYTILVLLVTGVPLESMFGFNAIVFIFSTSGVIGMAASTIIRPEALAAGGSAASAGLLGARFADVLKNGLALRGDSLRQTLLMNLTLFAIGLVLGFMPLIDNVAMVLSFGMGALAGMAWLRPRFKVGGSVRVANMTLIELLSGTCWLLLLVCAILNLNEVRSGQPCWYCKLPSWFPVCIDNEYWSCSGEDTNS